MCVFVRSCGLGLNFSRIEEGNESDGELREFRDPVYDTLASTASADPSGVDEDRDERKKV
jgi:hypothetical protein